MKNYLPGDLFPANFTNYLMFCYIDDKHHPYELHTEFHKHRCMFATVIATIYPHGRGWEHTKIYFCLTPLGLV